MTTKPQCTTPNCTQPQSGQGRDKCQSCYSTYARAVLQGKTTWEELEKNGLIAPAKITAGPATQHLAEVLGIGTGRMGRPRKKDGA